MGTVLAMRQLSAILWLGLLAGCGAAGAVQTALLPAAPASAPTVRFAQVLQADAPQMQLSVERVRASGIVVLDVTRDGTRTWLSPEGASFATRGGLLVATRGLGGDMLSSDVSQSQALLSARRNGQAQRFHTFIDGTDKAVTQTFVCDITVTGPRAIRIQNQPVNTTLMAENCANPTTQFQNLYWIETGTARISQSRQWAGEPTGPLALRPLRQEG